MAKLHADPLQVTDWITTAFEGGSNYWCEEARYLDEELKQEVQDAHKDTRFPAYALNEYWEQGGRMKIQDNEWGKWYEIDYDKLAGALQLDCISNEVGMRLITGEYDADDADLIMQAAVFGKIIFG